MAKTKTKSSSSNDSAVNAKANGANEEAKAAGPSTGSLANLGDVVGSQEAYERFLAEALALKNPIVAYRADARLAHFNVKKGVEEVLARKSQVAVELPGVSPKAFEELPDLTLGVVFAVSKAARAQGADEEDVAGKLERARELRGLMLSSAHTLARAKLLPEKTVAKIREGRGAADTAQDCVDLAALFREHAEKLKGKTPVTAANLKEAAEIGSFLVSAMKPKAARSKNEGGDVAAAADARDRLWTLAVQRHDLLRRVGVWLWGEAEVDEHVPLLQSRLAAPKKKKEAAASGNGAKQSSVEAPKSGAEAGEDGAGQPRPAAPKKKRAEVGGDGGVAAEV